ncbi:hypothetical protein ACS0TY_026104 [Phlomoides rotata]
MKIPIFQIVFPSPHRRALILLLNFSSNFSFDFLCSLHSNYTELFPVLLHIQFQGFELYFDETHDMRTRKVSTKSKKDDEVVKISKTMTTKAIAESAISCPSTPRGLFGIIKTLNNKQKDDVKNVGFGGLLYLQLNKCSHHNMLKWLVDHFNPSSRMLELDGFRAFSITPDDVHDVLMLPRNPGVMPVRYLRTDESPFLTRLHKSYGICPSSRINCLEDALKVKFPEGGDDFKRLFVFYSLLSFFIPSENRLIRTEYLKSLEDVDQIQKFDWCSFVLDKLCHAVKHYKNGVSKSLNGCILVLQIIYLHRLKWQGVAEPCTLPLIQHWTEKKLQDRCSQESDAGKYASGELVLNTYPVSINGVDKVCEETGAEKVGKKGPQKNFSEHEKIKDTRELLLSLKKDVNELVEKYMVRLVELSQEKEKHPSDSSSPYDDDFFKNIDELVKTVHLTKRLADDLGADDGVTDLGEEEEVRKVGAAPGDVDMENIAVEQSVQLPQEEEESQQVSSVHSSCSTPPQKRQREEQEEEESPSKRKKYVDETDGAAPPPGKTIKINKHVTFLLRKLLILDIDGILADIVEFPERGYETDGKLGPKSVFLRPHLQDFIQFCFAKFEVAVWTSRNKKNAGGFLKKHLRSHHIFFFVWDGNECDNVGDIPTEFDSRKRPVLLKKIENVWKLWPKYDKSNTLLIDDTPYTAMKNPGQVVLFGSIWKRWRKSQMLLSSFRRTHLVNHPCQNKTHSRNLLRKMINICE